MFKITNKKVNKQKSIVIVKSYQFLSWLFEQHVENNVIIYFQVICKKIRRIMHAHPELCHGEV
jgi:hypothetical protein